MKTQNFGTATSLRVPYARGLSFTYQFRPALKNYREHRENGAQQDNPKTPFPSAGFDALDVKESAWKSSNDWPDKQSRYWWKLTLNDGRVIEDFYWTEDKVRGYPDKSNKDRYWFIVHHKNGTKIEGFSQEPDYQKGFPDKDKNYWYTLRFTDTYSPAIRQWMEEKDKNYLARLKHEEDAAKVSESQAAKEKAKVKETTLKSPLKAVLAKDTKALQALSKKEDTHWREVDRHGNNVFHMAAKKGSVRVLKQLSQSVPLSLQKTLLHRMNDDGEMPHHIAAKAGKIEWIQALIPLGVDFNAKTEGGKTAEQLSTENGHVILAQFLGTMRQGNNLGAQQPGYTYAPPMFQAMYAFQSQAQGQLGLQKDEVVTVLQQNPNGWWHCQNSRGEQGWVPMNFLAPWQGHADSSTPPSPQHTPSPHRSSSHNSQEGEGSTPKLSSKASGSGSRVEGDEKNDALKGLIIPNSDLVLGRELGKGTFGAVYQGDWHGTRVAIKKLLEQKLNQDVENDFLHEAGLMKELQHENVVRLYGVSLNPYGMVLEFMARGSLDHLLHSSDPMSWQSRYTISLDVAKGLAFLHRKLVLHRDLKSLNVLLDEHYKAKLGDFGLSKIKTSSSQTYNAGTAGTLQWIAPELLMDTMGRYTPACDVYSYAMLLWEMLSRQIPYSRISNRALIPVHVSQGKREDIPPNSPAILSTLTSQCWAQDANERPTMAAVVKTLQESPVTDNRPLPSPYAQASTAAAPGMPHMPHNRVGQSGYQPSFQAGAMPAQLPTPPGQYAQGGGYAPSQAFFQPAPPNPQPQSGYGYQPPLQGGSPLPQPLQNAHAGSYGMSGYGNSGYGKG